VNGPEQARIYRSGRILRIGTPLLAVLTAAATTAGIQTLSPIDGVWAPVAAAAGGVAVASMLLMWRRVTRGRLEIFDGWFRYIRPERTLIARWEDVVRVFGPTTRRQRWGGRYEYVVVLGGGTTLRMGTEIGADAALGDEIERRTRSTVAVRTEAHISGGLEVPFGPITVSSDGVKVHTLGTRSIPFDRIRDHSLKGRNYRIRSMDHKRASTIPVSRIPSPGAMHDVIARHVEAARSARKPQRTNGPATP
jgi:hypothetical protein